MATPKQVKAWIAQADADLAASGADAVGIHECHRRYWLQQAYEKCIKAYALMKWNGATEDERQFARLFLLQHSPLKTVSESANPLSKALHLLSREVDTFVHGLDNDKFLRRIDATTPRSDPHEVSYRYPFVHEDAYIAPRDYTEWDPYQGNVMGARAAVGRLLHAVRDELKVFASKPQ